MRHHHWFACEVTSGEQEQKSILMTRHYPDLGNLKKKKKSEQHTATDLVNLLYFLRLVSSDHTDLIRDFEQDT